MKSYIAWGLISVLLVPLFVGSVWAIIPSVDPVAKAQRIIMMANQVRQITAAATQLATLTEQLTELKAQYQHIQDATMGQVQALTQPFTQLASQGTGLVSDGMSWKSQFSGVPAQLADAVSDMGSSGTSLTATWSGWLQQADTVSAGDIDNLFSGQAPDLAARGRESWERSRERADKTVVMNKALADAAALLAEALKEAKAASEDRKNQTNMSNTALAQAQLSESLTQGNLGVAQAQTAVYKAAKEAAQELEDERYRRRMIDDWTTAQQNAQTELRARLAAIDADRDAMRERMRFRIHPFYMGQPAQTP